MLWSLLNMVELIQSRMCTCHCWWQSSAGPRGLYPQHPFVVNYVIHLWSEREVPAVKGESYSCSTKVAYVAFLYCYWRLWTMGLRAGVTVCNLTGHRKRAVSVWSPGRPFLHLQHASAAELCVCVCVHVREAHGWSNRLCVSRQR